MKNYFLILVFIFLQHCSFDDKSGIWNNSSDISRNKSIFKEFKKLSSTQQQFNETIIFDEKISLNFSNPTQNFEWKDIYYSENNNLKNFNYKDLNEVIFKSKKITKFDINRNILFENNNLIAGDAKGNITVFSINQNKIISKFNFYKNKFKKIRKILNFTVENSIIYVSDNIGFLYAYDIKKNNIIWAKNYKIPFSSNLKIFEEKLIAANQNNGLYYFNKYNGESLNLIPTEETIFKNEFTNNLSLNGQILLYLNTYGTLYALNNKTMNIIWFLNLNQSVDLNPSNLFNGSKVISDKKVIVVSSNQFTYIVDIISGSILFKYNVVSAIKPIIYDNFLFLVTKNNLLICVNLKKGNLIYSYNINKQISDFLETKEKFVKFKNMMIINNQIFVFLENSYVLKYNAKGNLKKIEKISPKILSNTLIIDDSFIYVDNKNRILILN